MPHGLKTKFWLGVWFHCQVTLDWNEAITHAKVTGDFRKVT